MVKRELTRIIVLAGIGLMITFLIMFYRFNEFSANMFVKIPVYIIGMAYAIKTFIKLSGTVLKTYFSYQGLALLTKPLLGTILCIVLLYIVIVLLFKFIWVVGIIKCVICLWQDYQLDNQIREKNQTNDFYLY